MLCAGSEQGTYRKQNFFYEPENTPRPSKCTINISYTIPGAHEPPKAAKERAKERATCVPCKYKLVTYFRV